VHFGRLIYCICNTLQGLEVLKSYSNPDVLYLLLCIKQSRALKLGDSSCSDGICSYMYSLDLSYYLLYPFLHEYMSFLAQIQCAQLK
jgi:hypothetical protein